MVHQPRNSVHDTSPDEVEALLAATTSPSDPPDAFTAIDAWLNVLTRLVHLPDGQRSAIRSELAEHLRERTRDLMLSGRTETESVRLAIEELGETVQLARSFEAANRPHTRRWLMYASMLGFGTAVVVTGAVVLTPDQQPHLLATVFTEQEARSTDAARNLAEKQVDVSSDLPLLEVARVISEVAGRELVLSRAEFQERGIDVNDHFLELELRGVPINLALDRVVGELSRKSVPIAWHADDRIIEIAPKEVLDAREVTLVSYNIGDIIRSVTSYGRPYDHAIADVTSLLHELVEPQSWRENGGALAQLRVVGGLMFVQAPKPMHIQIEWILEQLRKDGGKPGTQLQQLPAPEARSRLQPGDVATVNIFELQQPNVWASVTRKVDGDGMFRVPEIGEVKVTGLNRKDFEERLVKMLEAKVMKNPKVDVVFEPMAN